MSAYLLVVLLSALIIAGTFARRWHAWRQGRRDVPVRLSGLLAIPKRFLVDVHAAVGRKPPVARMHIQAAGGLLGAGVLAVAALLGILSGPIGATVITLAGLTGISGALLDGARRLPTRPPHLSGGRYQRLPLLLVGANLFFLGAGASAALDVLPSPLTPAGLVLLVLGLVSLGALASEAGRGPLRHALAGTLHLAFHPRPGRFTGAPATALAPGPVEAKKFGADRVGDFAWNHLLGFDSCVQCGRCEEACPAFAAGQPLNPKKLINEIAGAVAPVHYAGSPHPGLALTSSQPGQMLLGNDGAIAPETLWACTTCRACVSSCPMMIEHLDAVIELRRFETLERGAAPGKAPGVLAALAETDTQSGRALSARLDFASDLTLPRIEPGREVEVLLWIGEAGFDLRNQRSLRALIQLLREAGIDFAVLDEERDCGDAARRLGDEIEFARLARANVETLSGFAFRRIVTMDPHVAHSFVRDYPAFGGNYDVSHHTSFLDELVRMGRLRIPAGHSGRITYHDPCYLGRYLGEFEAPRSLLDRLGADRIEMPRHARNSFCCGGGGGAALTDIEGRVRIPDLRVKEARETGADTVVVGCPTCTIMLEGVAEPRPVVREIAEVLLEAVRSEAGP
jgi:N,N-dimethylglycine/sarcosine dehydrogenase ferredoxin subunit